MQAVILCGGRATRLRPLTLKTPKSMVPIWGKPFLEYQIELLRKNKIKKLVLCIGYKGEQIKKYFGHGERFGINIKYSEEKKKLLGTAGALKNAGKLLQDNFLVIYGDSYLDFNYQAVIKHFLKNKKLGLMTVFKNKNKIEPNNVEIKNGYIVDYNKDKPNSRMEFIDYGLSIFHKEALRRISKNKFCDLSFLYKELIKEKQLMVFVVKKRYYQIGDFKGLKEFSSYIKKFLAKRVY